MKRYLLNRLVQIALTLFVVVTVTFFLFRVLPGDPSIALAGGDLSSDALRTIRQRFGLDQPLAVQYLKYVRNVILHGDFGISFWYSRPATEIVLERLGATLVLAIASFLVAYPGSVILASIMMLYYGRPLEQWLTRLVLILRASPVFWTGVLMVLIFAIQLGWLPHAGMTSPGIDPDMRWYERYMSLDLLRHLVLPTLAYAMYLVGLPTLLLRTTMLNELNQDYVELLRAKGLPVRRIVFRHVLRNALLPFVTTAGLFIGLAVGGQISIEYVFSWPGLGLALVQAISRRDYPVAQAGFVMVAVAVLVVNLLVDILYAYLNPRLEMQGG